MGDNKNTAELSRLIDALQALREGLGTGVSVERVIALLTVAKHTGTDGGIDQNELARTTSVDPSTMSRNVAALSDVGDRGRDPLKLIEVRFAPEDRRRRMVSTSNKGDTLVSKALSRLHGRK